MRFLNFDWDEINIEHIAQHGVDVEEVEAALVGKPIIRRGPWGRYLAFGRTAAGRYLFIVFQDLGSGWCRVITARDMSRPERRYYRRRGK